MAPTTLLLALSCLVALFPADESEQANMVLQQVNDNSNVSPKPESAPALLLPEAGPSATTYD